MSSHCARRLPVLLAACLLALPVAIPVAAQQAPDTPERRYSTWPGDVATEKALLRDLRSLIEQAARDRAASPAFLDDLRALANRHDTPALRGVLAEAFSDGDYTRDPVWIVARGEFWIERGYGLRSIVVPPKVASSEPRDTQREAAEQLLGAILSQVLDKNAAAPAKPAAPADALIHTRLRAGNRFTLEMEFWTGKESGVLELGIFQGREPGPGYRLALLPGERPSLTLSRIGERGDAVIDTAIRQLRLKPGTLHRVQWTRGDQGAMTVRIDGQQLLRVSDRAFADPLEGVSIRNAGGDFTIRRITLGATP
jgi:hypothetical protein